MLDELCRFSVQMTIRSEYCRTGKYTELSNDPGGLAVVERSMGNTVLRRRKEMVRTLEPNVDRTRMPTAII